MLLANFIADMCNLQKCWAKVFEFICWACCIEDVCGGNDFGARDRVYTSSRLYHSRNARM